MDAQDTSDAAPRPPAGALDVILAVARERLAELHLACALEFIEKTSPFLAPPRALSIYGRVHDLAEDEFRLIRNRVLATLATAADEPAGVGATFVGINGDVEWDVTASMLHKIRKRLGGRRNFELRRWVELHTGHVRARLLEVHVDAVRQLVDGLEPNRSIAEATRLYTRSIGARRDLFDTLYTGVLDALYRESPEIGGKRPRRKREPEPERHTKPLRVVGDG